MRKRREGENERFLNLSSPQRREKCIYGGKMGLVKSKKRSEFGLEWVKGSKGERKKDCWME